MRAELERRKGVGEEIVDSMGWAGRTVLILTAWRGAAAVCGLAEIVTNKSCKILNGISDKFDEIRFRRTNGLNQRGRHG